MSCRVMALWTLVLGCAVAGAEEVEAISRPSADTQLAFVRPGLVARLLVRPGDHIKKDQVLAELDSQIEDLRIRQLEREIQTDTRRQMEEQLLEQKKRDHQSMKEAFEKGAGTGRDVEHALLEVRKSEQSLRQLDFERQQQLAKLDEAKVLREQTILKAALDGRVEEVLVECGEAAEPLKGVIRVVQINPLWLDIPVPQLQAAGLKVGDLLQVRDPDAPGGLAQGKIIFKTAVADAASETAIVRLELPNPRLQPAGGRYQVLIPEGGHAR